ncbi:MAG: hypothetical protein HC921_11940 [Synechococcaceae cyanobacterium SM2_3_1]|nr:hypothetical protein [Synechococcaceae cyanobacterium SM2_3_1]
MIPYLPLLLLLGGVAGVAQIPLQVQCRWRKPWGAGWVWRGQVRWGGCLRLHLSRQGRWQLGRLRGDIPLWKASVWWPLLHRHPQRSGRLLIWLLQQSLPISLQGHLILGFRNPVHTARGIALLAALPPPLAHQIAFSFAHEGWCSRGSLTWTPSLGQSLRLLLQGLWIWGFGPIQGRDTAG